MPNNGSIEPCGNEYRSVCNFTCDPGYIVSAGDLSRECLSTGLWGGETLKCSGKCYLGLNIIQQPADLTHKITLGYQLRKEISATVNSVLLICST